MDKVKVMSIFGTRPEATKMAPLIKAMDKCDDIEQVVCVTAQHRQMLDQVLEIFDLKPDYDLDIMTQRQTLTSITVKALTGLEEVMKDCKPDLVLVHGDTTTTFAGALAAFYNDSKLGHVEAGLRTYDKHQPFPEEMNRVLTGHMADLHFAPTKLAKEHLLKENISPDNIFITGNTAVDCLKTTISDDFKFDLEELNNIDYKNKRVITMTAHRRENLGKPLENICNALKQIVTEYEDVELVYPVHLNPAVRETAFGILGDMDRVHLIDPLDVEELHNAMSRSFMVMTDSGGIQEEAPALAKPVLVLRKETERPEAVAAGTVKIAGVEKDDIVRLAKELLDSEDAYNKMAHAANPYGDGEASRRTVEAILYAFGYSDKRPENFSVK